MKFALLAPLSTLPRSLPPYPLFPPLVHRVITASDPRIPERPRPPGCSPGSAFMMAGGNERSF